VGEVTLVTANAFRIFMQSYIFYVPALLIGISWVLGKGHGAQGTGHRALYCEFCTGRDTAPRAPRPAPLIWLVTTFVVLGISLSRSIWIGCFAGLVVLAWFCRKNLLKVWKEIGKILLSGIIALVIIFATIAFPIPSVDYASLGDLFGSRASASDAAAVSRWNLLPVIMDKIKQAPIIGHGFGATVTYETKDPRLLVDHPDGMYTTYAFEWGWLEHWVKFGVIGFGVIVWLVISLLRRTLALKEPKWLIYGVFASLVGIAATHIFSPYFNHPLGIGALLAVEGFLMVNE
jgi:hypothetical protein